MKKIFAAVLSLAFVALPSFAQKMSKEEKAAAAKASYEAALAAINAKAWVLIPSSYQLEDGSMESNDNNDIFLSYEGENAFSQGAVVCGNGNTNIGEASSYDVTVDKKGNIKLLMVISGRMWRGTYKISIKNSSNQADVIFTQQSGPTLRFQGPVIPLAEASYNKRSNPI